MSGSSTITETEVQRVLQSKCFERASTLRALLFYLWENRDENISEYAIAVDALKRNADFESKVDATVRVQVWRLRKFLVKYYETEGKDSAFRLEIPLGTHQVRVVDAQSGDVSQAEEPSEEELPEVQEAPSEAHRLAPRPPVAWSPAFALGAMALVAMLVFAAFGAYRVAVRSHPVAVAKQDLPPFWKRFSDNGNSIRIVLPTPLFFAWSPVGKDDFLMVRDVSVNEFDRAGESEQLAGLERKLGKPSSWQHYTAAADTFASLRLARFLDSYGVDASISSPAQTPSGIVDHENLIAFGTTNTLSAYSNDLKRLSFELGPGDRYVLDKRQTPGLPPQFQMIQESSGRSVIPGLIALLPKEDGRTRLLVVEGTQTSALITYLTSEAGMREMSKAIDDAGQPYFEAVVLSEVTATSTIQSRLVAFRSLDPKAFSNH